MRTEAQKKAIATADQNLEFLGLPSWSKLVEVLTALNDAAEAASNMDNAAVCHKLALAQGAAGFIIMKAGLQ
jgi:hypothetical protein